MVMLRSRKGRLLVVFAALVTAVFIMQRSAQTQSRSRGPLMTAIVDGREVVAGDILVKFARPLATAEQESLDQEVDADESRSVGGSTMRRFHSRRFSVETLRAYLSGHPLVKYAEPNYVIRALAVPNDPSFPLLWGLKNVGQTVGGQQGHSGSDIHASDAWDISTGSAANVVTVIDTGIDYTHPDLAANIWSAPRAFTVTVGGQTITCAIGTHGFNALTGLCDPRDDHFHGTHVSGTIGAAGNNGVGVVGVNWTTRIMGLKFLDSSGFGTIEDAVNMIEFAIRAKAALADINGANVRVLSNSWSGGGFSQLLFDEINSANASDMLFVAAAGNNGLNNSIFPEYPASYVAPNVIAVAATDNTDILASWSNYGSNVHLAAPGVGVLSTTIGACGPNGCYGYASGTSMATPHVAGAAALVLSKCALNTAALKSNLLANVDVLASLAGRVGTGGRLNVDKAIRACALPATPAGLTATGGNGVVTLAWSAAAGALTYNVKRATTSGGPYATIATGVSSPNYSDPNVNNGTTYYYVVSAVNASGESPNSNQASVTPGLVITATGGTPQTANIGAVFPSPLQATVKNASNNPVAGATVTFTAPLSGASASFSGSNVATAVTNASGIATSPALTANGILGSYSVTAAVDGAPAPASFSLTNGTPPPQGTLTGSSSSSLAEASLTSEGPTDWLHLGESPLNHKAGVTPVLSYVPVGAGSVVTWQNHPQPLGWTDGAPTAMSAANHKSISMSGLGKGFTVTAPADTLTRVLTVHVGGGASGGTLTAHLSDGSAVDFVSATPLSTGLYARTYTLTYAALSAGQTLGVTWVVTTGAGFASLAGVSLNTLPSRTVVASAGTPQSTAINTPFVTPLRAQVQDFAANPVPGVTVTFTAPSSGASGLFSGSAVATAVTDASGMATAPALTANGQTGSYTVTATVVAGTGPANFSLTNTPAPQILATAGTPQNATINTAFGSALTATVLDGNGQPMSGASVTFAAPVNGASATFGGSASTTVLTNGNGVASVSAMANGVAGSYTVTATLNGFAAPPVSFALTNVPVPTMTATGGTPQSTNVNTAFGAALAATVLDGNGQPLSNASVTFTAPASGASATFGGSGSTTVLTNGSGVATASATANGVAGGYTVSATLNGFATPPVSFALTNTTPPPPQGQLTGTTSSGTVQASLTLDGSIDWLHFGDPALNRKAGVPPLLSYAQVGSGIAGNYGQELRPLGWTDGSPTAISSGNRNALYIVGLGKGFSITAPADTATRVLTIYVGAWSAGATLRAHLSDGSAADFVEVIPTASGQFTRTYTLTYSAGSAGQTLQVTWVNSSGSGVLMLDGAALKTQ